MWQKILRARAGLRVRSMGVAALVLLGVWVAPARGQQKLAAERLRQETEAGVQAFRAKDWHQAQLILERVAEKKVAYVSPAQGPVAYWLGKSFQAQGALAKALDIWEKALTSLDKKKGSYPVLADAYLRGLYEEGLKGNRMEAARAYARLMKAVGHTHSPQGAAVVHHYVAQVEPLLPKQQAEAIIEKREGPPEEWTFSKGAGEQLLGWWRAQDPLPATERNERVDEHLERLAYALQHFSQAERTSGLSDRGIIYLKYGPPDVRRSIDFSDGKFYRDVFRFGTSLSRSDFPANEYWGYPSIARAAHFLFAKGRKGAYHLVTTNELLPYKLRHVLPNTPRGQNQAVSALAALRYIYRHLAQYHSDYSSRYSKISHYALQQEEQRIVARADGWKKKGQRSGSVGAGPGKRRVFSNPALGVNAPRTFVQHALNQAKVEDEQAARRRRRAMGKQRGRPLKAAPLPVIVRAVRFLDDDGTTRTEVHWSVPPGALQPQQQKKGGYGYYYISMVGTKSDADYQRRSSRRKLYALKRSREVDAGVLTPQRYTTSGDTGTYHLALQWDEYLARAQRGPPKFALGPHLKMHVQRFDSLTALTADESALEMSDLEPMTAPEERVQAGGTLIEAAQPYPFDRIAADASLLLYFEVYHLTYGPDDQTRYTVEYQVQRRTETGGGLFGLFGGDEKQRTSTQTTYTGRSRRTKEYILLNLNNVKTDEEGAVAITVRVTDEHTGQVKERTIRFAVDPRPKEE